MDNKDGLIKGVKVLGLVIWGMAVIATCAAVWNAAAPGIICVAAGITMLTSGWSIFKEAKKLKD